MGRRTKIKQSVNFFVEAVKIPVRLFGKHAARRERKKPKYMPHNHCAGQERSRAARLKRGQGLRAEWEIDDCGSAGTGRCTVAKCGRE